MQEGLGCKGVLFLQAEARRSTLRLVACVLLPASCCSVSGMRFSTLRVRGIAGAAGSVRGRKLLVASRACAR